MCQSTFLFSRLWPFQMHKESKQEHKRQKVTGLKGRNGEEPIQNARDEQGEDGAHELKVTSGQWHEPEEEPSEVKPLRPWALSYLGEVVDSEWSLDELERRGVPTKEAQVFLCASCIACAGTSCCRGCIYSERANQE